jgi:hypothetical protein
MKRCEAVFGVVAVVILLGGSSAFAFPPYSGNFSGFYAPANWTAAFGGNPSYENTALVRTNNAPQSIEIDGAVDAQSSTPQGPASVIDYTIALTADGLEPIAFNYVFNGASDGIDAAQLIYSTGSGIQFVVNLSAVTGVQQTFSGQLPGGGSLGFRVYSNNDKVPDSLVISAVPEPSTLALLGLGISALGWKLRRRRS